MTAVRRLVDIAHARTGDKGDTSQIAVFAKRSEDYALILKMLTPERVKAHFPGLAVTRVRRYELHHLHAVNLVLEGALSGGVTRSLSLDAHGKTLGAQLLSMAIDES